MDELLTIKDVQKILKVSHNTAYKICNLPDFPKIKFGRCIRVSMDDLSEYIKQKRGCVVNL